MSKNGCIVHMVVWIEMQNIIGSKCKILFVKTFAGGILKRNTRVSTVQHLISVFTEQCNGLAAQVAVIYQSSVPVSMPVQLLLTVSRHAAQGLCYHLKCSILSRFHKESQKYECFKRHGYKSPINQRRNTISLARFTDLCLELKQLSCAVQFSFSLNQLSQLDAFKMGPFFNDYCIYFAVRCTVVNSDKADCLSKSCAILRYLLFLIFCTI